MYVMGTHPGCEERLRGVAHGRVGDEDARLPLHPFHHRGNVVVSADYAHPNEQLYFPPNFLAFTSNQMSHECTYNNPGPTQLHAGDSEFSSEVCYAIGYFFPAAHPSLCLNGLSPL